MKETIINLAAAENATEATRLLRNLLAAFDAAESEEAIEEAIEEARDDLDSDNDICDALSTSGACDIVAAITMLERIANNGDAVMDLYGNSGANGVWFPGSETEKAYAEFWSSSGSYTWGQMLDDIDLDDAGSIMSADQEAYWDAAKALGDEEHARELILEQLAADDGYDERKQLACDAVDFEELDALPLAILRAIY